MKNDAIIQELIEAATEVKYKSQRLKDALRAAENVPKRDSFSDKPVAWMRDKGNGIVRFMEHDPYKTRETTRIHGSGWVALYMRLT